MKVPKRIEMSAEQLDALVARVRNGALEEEDPQIIETMADTIKFLSSAVDEKNMSIERLRRMLFGARTEKTKNIVKQSSGESERTSGAKKQKAKGHGRNGAEDYSGAQKVEVKHQKLKAKDQCPKCLKGKVYLVKVPGRVLWIVGKAPLEATVYELEKLRCNLCGEIFTAACPEERCAEGKYDESAGSMIAVLKYGSGFPFYRLEKLQKSFGVPMAASTQWQIVERKANTIYAAYEELVRQAAQGEGYRDMPASPTFITVPILWAGVNQEVVKSLGVDFAKLLVAGEAYEYLQEIYTGDVLTGKVSVTEIADKTGKTGIMEFITLETVFVNQNGQEVIKVFTSLVERK